MDQIKTGKFIAGLRKEKGLTQAQLAEKLNITDRAVSKWETGKSMPDSSIMLELCGILGITVNELLSGERIEMNNYEEKANENLIELKRKDENHIRINRLIATVYSVFMVFGAVICCICDFSITKTLSWSIITLAAIVLAWAISFPVILQGKKGIRTALILLTVLILPFIYLLSVLTKVRAVFSIGAAMAIISLVFIWGVFLLFSKYNDRKFLATGLTILLAMLVSVVINVVLSRMLEVAVFDIWDVLEGVALTTLAVVCIVVDRAKRRKYGKSIL